MTSLVRRLFAGASVVAVSVLAPAAIASAAVTVPFQINPAPFGNPNGSFDAPPVHCVAIVGEQPGTVKITGAKDERWGCMLSTEVRWLNLSTGASGTGQLSGDNQGIPGETTLQTGAGQVAVAVLPASGPITPGFATFFVP
ncbi:hypothetical protein R3Q06_26020 [Rhodococcus erythropolis]|uniref:hypothetical protein n=1 Tax=Rhodococcus erythropolis TaxID=1833 RepID=UPI002948FAE0|nr:hypothetical protein [Rhodococcus erythropolis]MDV6276957.1 hypothetical protein [Rhodococcus erythropolis]